VTWEDSSVHFVLSLIHVLLWIFIGLMWVRFVVDWVQVFARSWSPTGILLIALEVVYSVTDPPIKALRKVIPPLRIGQIAIDLSFIIVMIVAYLLLSVVGSLERSYA
jgi:YggT family protein